MITVGPQQTGAPTKPGVYVVRYAFRRSEHYAWFDGRNFSVPHANAVEAEVDNRGRDRLRLGMRSWLPVVYWREFWDDGQGMVDALRKAGGG
jgi:hypothetical protein